MITLPFREIVDAFHNVGPLTICPNIVVAHLQRKLKISSLKITFPHFTVAASSIRIAGGVSWNSVFLTKHSDGVKCLEICVWVQHLY